MNPLRETAERLPGHWYQGNFSDVDGEKHCGKGHLINVFTEAGIGFYNGNFNLASNLMDRVAIEQYPDRAALAPGKRCAFVNFNDHDDTTEDEVVAVLEKAAVMWDEQV